MLVNIKFVISGLKIFNLFISSKLKKSNFREDNLKILMFGLIFLRQKYVF